MNKETLRMQMLSGIITESEYKAKLEENLKEGFLSNFLSKLEQNTGILSDVLTVVDLARKDEEGGAEKAVKLMIDKHGLSEEEALKVVQNIYNKFEKWIHLTKK